MARIANVDILRTVAIIAVIIIHTAPFKFILSPNWYSLNLPIVINQAARFAVPFFFVLAGYFWANRFKDKKELCLVTLKMLKRILILFLAWSAIYILPTNIIDSFIYGIWGPFQVIHNNVMNVVTNPFAILIGGTKIHLWFLSVLLLSLLIAAIFIYFNFDNLLIIIAIILFLIGLTGKAYSDTAIGFHSSFDFRNGPFFSLICFVTGYFLQRKVAS